jgi:hypothetical protein
MKVSYKQGALLLSALFFFFFFSFYGRSFFFQKMAAAQLFRTYSMPTFKYQNLFTFLYSLAVDCADQ